MPLAKIMPLSWCCSGLWSDKHSLLSPPLNDWNLFARIKELSSSPARALSPLMLLIGTKEAQSRLSQYIWKRMRPFCCTFVTPNAGFHGGEILEMVGGSQWASSQFWSPTSSLSVSRQQITFQHLSKSLCGYSTEWILVPNQYEEIEWTKTEA